MVEDMTRAGAPYKSATGYYVALAAVLSAGSFIIAIITFGTILYTLGTAGVISSNEFRPIRMYFWAVVLGMSILIGVVVSYYQYTSRIPLSN